MKISRLARALLLLIVCACPSPAQWDKKPYTEWSEKEAERLLEKSAWAHTQVFTDTSNKFAKGPGPSVTSSQTRVSSLNQVSFHIRFLSAKPVRQALSRIMELRQKGSMSDQFATQLKAFVNQDFADYVIVTVTADGTESRGRLQEAKELLNSLTTADLKEKTFLIVKDQQIPLEEYQAPSKDGLGARFIFPRIVDGKPIITPDSDEVTFVSPLTDTFNLNMRYKVKDMMFQGKVEY